MNFYANLKIRDKLILSFSAEDEEFPSLFSRRGDPSPDSIGGQGDFLN